MNIGTRSRLSLCQLMNSLLNQSECILLLQKYGMPTDDIDGSWMARAFLDGLRLTVLNASSSQIGEIIQEVARTRGSIRSNASPRYLFDERWRDLTLSLELDNYVLARDEYGDELDYFVPLEPVIEGTHPVEDDLSKELRLSGLPDSDDIRRRIEDSAKAFLGVDYNGCLNNARVALETAAKSITRQGLDGRAAPATITKWGEALTWLKDASFISVEQEKGLAGVYRFASPGSHVPVGFTESEFARLGRTLALSCTYFLIKHWNGSRR